MAISPFDYREMYRRNLPHWQPPEATLFITFRLDGSIPEPVLARWRVEKKHLEMNLLRWAALTSEDAPPDPLEVAAKKLNFHRRWFKKFEDALDGRACGPLWLQEEKIAAIVDDALRYRDGLAYRLDAYCIMPNHVHVVFAPYLTVQQAQVLAAKFIFKRTGKYAALAAEADDDAISPVLSSIMQSLKGRTARLCNLALQRTGQFWQHESYDHVIRKPGEWERIVSYVVNNPVKAGLAKRWQDWPWTYHRQSVE